MEDLADVFKQCWLADKLEAMKLKQATEIVRHEPAGREEKAMAAAG
jgi:hypothetical protein